MCVCVCFVNIYEGGEDSKLIEHVQSSYINIHKHNNGEGSLTGFEKVLLSYKMGRGKDMHYAIGTEIPVHSYLQMIRQDSS